jgi:hypothetical protein
MDTKETPYVDEKTAAPTGACSSGHELFLKAMGSTEAPSIPDTGTRTDFKTGAVRDGMEGKGIPSLIPVFPMHLLSVRLEEGAKKYGRDNWRKGIPLSRYVDGLMRHLNKWRMGWEDEDHEGAMMFNIVGLIETAHQIRMGNLPTDLDDLPERPIASKEYFAPTNWALNDLYMNSMKDPYEETDEDKARLTEAKQAVQR